MTLSTTSHPLLSAPSHLYVHMPSVLLFQYAPVALCIPLLPLVGACVTSPFVACSAASSVVEVPVEFVFGGSRFWITVLVTAYLYLGVGVASVSAFVSASASFGAGEVSARMDLSTLLCSLLALGPSLRMTCSRSYNDATVPSLRFVVIVIAS